MSREQEFYQELMQTAREKLKLYCSVAVDTEENGALARIRGKLLFQQELDRLTEPAFTEEEKQQYQMAMAPILEHEKALYRKAAEYLQEGILLGLPYLVPDFPAERAGTAAHYLLPHAGAGQPV